MTYFIGGNHIQLLRNGAEYFPALEQAIHQAAHEIYLQTYIYQADVTGIRIGDALKKAALRGVNVNMLLDGFGSKDLPKAYVQSLEESGIKVLFYRQKISPWSLKKRRLRRLHSKTVAIDGAVGFVGGINIIDDNDIPQHTSNQIPPRIDYAVRIEGKLSLLLRLNMQKLWQRIAWIHFKQTDIPPLTINQTQAETRHNTSTTKAALVIRDNVLHRRDIENAYLAAIHQAQTEIIIANAYFVPGRKFRMALIAAAKRGVTVKLLLQGRMEYFVMFATHAFYHEFLTYGIEIYEYHKSFMHSKVAVIDQHWATVGSSNIDPFSLLLARETNVVVKNSVFASTLRADIALSIHTGAVQVDAATWAQSNLLKRVASWLIYGIVRLLLGVIGHTADR